VCVHVSACVIPRVIVHTPTSVPKCMCVSDPALQEKQAHNKAAASKSWCGEPSRRLGACMPPSSQHTLALYPLACMVVGCGDHADAPHGHWHIFLQISLKEGCAGRMGRVEPWAIASGMCNAVLVHTQPPRAAHWAQSQHSCGGSDRSAAH